MKEDAHCLRSVAAPQVMTTLCSTAVATLRMIRFTSTTLGRRCANRDATRATADLGLTT